MDTRLQKVNFLVIPVVISECKMVYHNIILNMLNKYSVTDYESVEFLQLKGLYSLLHHCQSSHSPPRYSAHLSWSVDMNEHSMSTAIHNM